MTLSEDPSVMQSELTTLRQRNLALSTALRNIVHETMDYPPVKPYNVDSYLPEHLIEAAQLVLAQNARHDGQCPHHRTEA